MTYQRAGVTHKADLIFSCDASIRDNSKMYPPPTPKKAFRPDHTTKADTALCAPPAALLAPVRTTFPPCLAAVRPKLSRSNTAGVGVNLANDWLNGDIGGELASRPIARTAEWEKVGVAVTMGVRESVLSKDERESDGGEGDCEGGDRRLRTTGRRVRAERKMSLAINVGSRRRLDKLSPVFKSSDPADEEGRARRERMLPTEAVT